MAMLWNLVGFDVSLMYFETSISETLPVVGRFRAANYLMEDGPSEL